MQQAGTYVNENIGRISQSRQCKLALKIDPATSGISGDDSFSQLLFSVLEGTLDPFTTKFSYFPADRALPPGEMPIQLGAVDAAQQLESHNSAPASKYQRLKNTIFASLVDSPESKEILLATFSKIFTKLLTGRAIETFGVNQYGQASIIIKDTITGETFDIDSMSSGEKGLILTFLIIARSIEAGGMILIDEPELHLNPAVCKSLLGFLLDEYLLPKNIQAIICSHSAEIFSTAMRRADCSAYHLRQGSIVSEIRKKDQPEVAQALRLLGTSEVEEMLYEGVIFVEGEDDVDLLEAGFPEMLAKIKFRELSGRGQVEKHIRKLQEAETKGQKENISYFLFDQDRKPSTLKSSLKVKIKQWDRYCLENYLIDSAVLFDVLRQEKLGSFPSNLGEASKLFADTARTQLVSRVIEEVYDAYEYENPGLRPKEVSDKNFGEAAQVLFARLEAVQAQVLKIKKSDWDAEFVKKCESLLQAREQEWQDGWLIKCNGKQFFRDLYVKCGIGVAPLILKRRILMQCKLTGSEGWKLLQAALKELLEMNTPA